MVALKKDITNAAGPLQTCAGVQGGIEASVHAMREVFCDEQTEAILLVDAENAFNRLNREASLLNMNIVCPEFQKYLINTYRDPSHLYVNGGKGDYILSQEGSTQGDNAAMSMYACSIKPLIDSLSQDSLYAAKINRPAVPKAHQVWYADDSAAAGKLVSVLVWWNELVEKGPYLGYYPEPTKSHLIVKNEDVYQRATQLFHGSGIKITLEGRPYLGSTLGTAAFTRKYVEEKVQNWVNDITSLAEIANTEPHAAYYGFINGVSKRWTYVMRTTNGISDLFLPLEEAINNILIPSLIGRTLTPLERRIFSLPAKYGGMGILNPVEIAETEYAASLNITRILATAIKDQSISFEGIDWEQMKREKSMSTSTKNNANREKLRVILADEHLTPHLERALELANEKGSSLWLTTQPCIDHGFFLNKIEFKDALCLRYNWQIKGISKHCTCGEENDVDHCLICKKGGYVTLRHNALRNTEAAIITEVCHDVKIEPTLIPVENAQLNQGANIQDGARLDVSARGVWSTMDRVFFDIRVTHPNTQSNFPKPTSQIYREHEREKKNKYNQRVIDIEKGTFTPLVFTTSGGMAPECERLNKRLAELLAAKRNERYADVIAYIRKRLRFSLLKATLIAIRGYRGPQNRRTPVDLSDVAFNLTY